MTSYFSLHPFFLFILISGYYYNLGYYNFKIRYYGTPTKIHIKYVEGK
jgi:hypothetical protein